MKILFLFLFLLPLVAESADYHCRFYVREELLQQGTILEKEFTGEPIEIENKNFIAKIKPVIVEEKDTLALWVGTKKKNQAAVALFDMGYAKPYLNIILDGVFLEVKCSYIK